MEHIIERIYRFLLEYIDEKGTLIYLDKIDEMISEDQRSLYVDLQHLESFDPVVVDEIISSPKDGLTSASDALKQVLLGKEPDYLTRMQNRLHLRFVNPPDRIKKSLRKIRSAALGTLLYTEAIITKSTEVKPYLEVAAFRCVRCQALQPSIRFTEGEYNPPFACINASNHDDPCTSKTFNLIKDQSTFIDFQRVTLQEKPEELPSGQMPESLTMFMRDDLCDLIRPGDRVKVVGIMESRTDAVLTRGKMPLFLKYIEGVSITKETEEFTDIEISEEDEQAIKNLAQDPNIHRMIRNSIAPVIFGALEEKEAISYLLFGGTSKKASDGTKIRGESNILLIGDPGMGKSQILKSVADLVPRGLYTSGRGSSAAGLCVAADSKLFLDDGIFEIGHIVESEFTLGKQEKYSDGIYFKQNLNPKNKAVNSSNLKIKASNIDRYWKLKSPKLLFSITLKTGRSIKLTPQTPLLSISSKDGLLWISASNLKINNRIATIHKITFDQKSPPRMIEHLKTYQREITLINVGKSVSQLIDSGINKLNISKRELASRLNISEDNIYYRYVNDDVDGNISFQKFSQLCKIIDEPVEKYLRFPLTVQIKKGQSLILPEMVSIEWFYILGLIFGDGRVSKSSKISGGESYTLALSNNENFLIELFNNFFLNLGLKPYISKASSSRPQEIRIANALLFHIFSYYGLIESPKSDKINPNNIILNYEENILVSLLKGLYDSDGWIFKRKEDSEGSSQIGYASTSRSLIDFIQNALLKFGIISYVKEKLPKTSTLKDGRKIIGRHTKYELVFSKYSDFVKFKENIGFKHPKKQNMLEKLCTNSKLEHSNIDTVPNVYPILSEIFKFYNLNSVKVFGRKGALTKSNQKDSISKLKLKKILDSIDPNINNNRVKLSKELRSKIYNNLISNYDKDKLMKELKITSYVFYEYFERNNRNCSYPFGFIFKILHDYSFDLEETVKRELGEIATSIIKKDSDLKEKIRLLMNFTSSDIFWDKIKSIELIESENDFVYDLTVTDSHNFIANAIIVHNTASVIRDPDTGEMTLEAGAVVLADKGIAFIDEFDKMRKEDRSALHESMEQHSVSIAKAGIVATLNARTSILAAANPKLGRWDTKKDAIDNLNLPSTIISRFDLIFPIIDKPNRSEDELKASHILKIHQQIEPLEATEESLNKLLLRKYIAYARKNVHPFLTNEAREEIMKFYLDLREGKGLESAVTEYNADEGLAQQAQKPRTIAITPRQLESLIRLSEARAKIALRDEVSREDAVRVIELFKQSLNRVTKGDIDTLYGMSSQKRNKRETILTIITNLSHSDATPDMDDIMRKGREEGLEDSDIRDMIDQLLQNGEIYEPRPGTFKKMSD